MALDPAALKVRGAFEKHYAGTTDTGTCNMVADTLGIERTNVSVISKRDRVFSVWFKGRLYRAECSVSASLTSQGGRVEVGDPVPVVKVEVVV